MGLFLCLSFSVVHLCWAPWKWKKGAPPCQFSWVISSQKTAQEAHDHKEGEPGAAAAGSQENQWASGGPMHACDVG